MKSAIVDAVHPRKLSVGSLIGLMIEKTVPGVINITATSLTLATSQWQCHSGPVELSPAQRHNTKCELIKKMAVLSAYLVISKTISAINLCLSKRISDAGQGTRQKQQEERWTRTRSYSFYRRRNPWSLPYRKTNE